MTRLAAGSKKLLLINTEAVERNTQRSPSKRAPVGAVLVLDENNQPVEVHNSDDIVVKGDVQLVYAATAHLVPALRHWRGLRAAYATTAEVVIGEGAEPELAEQTPDTTSVSTNAKPSRPSRPPRTTNVKTEEATNGQE